MRKDSEVHSGYYTEGPSVLQANIGANYKRISARIYEQY